MPELILCKNKKSVVFTFSQCSQQKFLIHDAWIPLKKKKRKLKKITKINFFLFKNNKVLVR